jgi:hypothetical protein
MHDGMAGVISRSTEGQTISAAHDARHEAQDPTVFASAKILLGASACRLALQLHCRCTLQTIAAAMGQQTVGNSITAWPQAGFCAPEMVVTKVL